VKCQYYDYCYKGLTLNISFSNTENPKVTIEGRERPEEEFDDIYKPTELSNLSSEELKRFAKKVIKRFPGYKKRQKIRKDHLERLKKGVSEWNEWREKHPEIRPILYDCDLTTHNFTFSLERVDFANTELVNSNLSYQNLVKANFHEANLKKANLQHALLTKANLCRTNLYKTNLKEAKLAKANLQGAQLANTNLEGAELNWCKVFGASAWNLNLAETDKSKMTFKYGLENKEKNDKFKEKLEMTVDNLEAAQLIFLLLDNPKIYKLLESVKDKIVLILGRFTKERKAVLDAIRESLRENDLVPIIFDFEKPKQQNFTETIMTLAGISKFIIADITNPSSTPLELQATMPDYMIPFVPIIQKDEKPFSMFQDLKQKYGEWVLDVLEYDTTENLLRVMREALIDTANEKAEKLREKKDEKLRYRSVEDYLR
jgi:hypothetical protein